MAFNLCLSRVQRALQSTGCFRARDDNKNRPRRSRSKLADFTNARRVHRPNATVQYSFRGIQRTVADKKNKKNKNPKSFSPEIFNHLILLGYLLLESSCRNVRAVIDGNVALFCCSLHVQNAHPVHDLEYSGRFSRHFFFILLSRPGDGLDSEISGSTRIPVFLRPLFLQYSRNANSFYSPSTHHNRVDFRFSNRIPERFSKNADSLYIQIVFPCDLVSLNYLYTWKK